MEYNPHALIVRVDGSVPRNPGPKGGFGMVIEFPDHLHRSPETRHVPFGDTNISRMELRAVIAALEYVRNQGNSFSQALIITDSKYVVQNQKYAPKWKQDKWVKADGTPVHNPDLWDAFLKARSKVRMSCEVRWEKGKSSEIARQVDKLAKKAAQSPIRRTDTGHIRGKLGKAPLPGATTQVSIEQQELVVLIYKKRPLGPPRNVTQVSMAICGADLQPQRKEFAYATPTMSGRLSRSHYYVVVVDKGYIVELLHELTPPE